MKKFGLPDAKEVICHRVVKKVSLTGYALYISGCYPVCSGNGFNLPFVLFYR